MNVTDSAGRNIPLGIRLGRGGEAEVFPVTTDSTVVAKIYHSPSAERAAKLQVMLANPPSDPTAAQGHVSICWPTGLLFDHRNVSVGFLMHRVDLSSNFPVFSLYNPQDRQQVAPAFTWEYLLRSAKNVASAVEAVHARGYVVGDLNESNILVANTAMVTVVDCDSMQVPQPGTGMFFRCPVGKPEYTPPELQGCEFSRVDRVVGHDNFSLGVLIFQLLMEGTHPFSGVWQAAGDPPPIEERIRVGASPYITTLSAKPMPGAPPLSILPASLQSLFQRCFRDGHQSPGSRPTPKEWQIALAAVEADLSTCPNSRVHIYSAHLASCPWCERRGLLGGFDPFPVNPQKRPLKQPRFATPAPVPQIVTVPTPPGPVPVANAPPATLPMVTRTAAKPVWTRRIVIAACIVAATLLGFLVFNRPTGVSQPTSQPAVSAVTASTPSEPIPRALPATKTGQVSPYAVEWKRTVNVEPGCGLDSGTVGSNEDLWLACDGADHRVYHLDSAGKLLSVFHVPGIRSDEINKLRLAASGGKIGLLVSLMKFEGRSVHNLGAFFGFVTSDGIAGAPERIAGDGPDFSELISDPDGGFIVAGDQSPLTLIKLNRDGKPEWQQALSPSFILPQVAVGLNGVTYVLSQDSSAGPLTLQRLGAQGQPAQQISIPASQGTLSLSPRGILGVLYTEGSSSGRVMFGGFDREMQRLWSTPTPLSGKGGRTYRLLATSDGYVGLGEGAVPDSGYIVGFNASGEMTWDEVFQWQSSPQLLLIKSGFYLASWDYSSGLTVTKRLLKQNAMTHQ